MVFYVFLEIDMYSKVSETHRPAVETLEDARGYGTKDLFTKHPTKNLWKL